MNMRESFEKEYPNRWPSAVRYSEETNSFYPESPSARRDADERSILWKGYQSGWQASRAAIVLPFSPYLRIDWVNSTQENMYTESMVKQAIGAG